MAGRRPRVLSLATLYPNAHTPQFGTFVASQFEALARLGSIDLTVFNPIGVPPLALGRYRELARAAQDGVEGGVPVYRPTFTLVPKFGSRLNPRAIAKAVLSRAIEMHARQPFDLVDAQFFFPDGPAAARVAKALNLPLSIKARGADISYWGQQAHARKAMLKAAGRAGGLLSVSEALADDMAAIGLPREKITIHYTGLDTARFKLRDQRQARRDAAARMAIPQGGPLLVTLGALIERKGQALVLDALANIPDVQLVLVGTGPDESVLRKQASKAGLSDRVHFAGSLDHDSIAVLLSAADAMVLASASEGLANAWVEALACGCPLVITDVGGARELVRSEAAGKLVERHSGSVAQGIREVLATDYPRADVAQTVANLSWDNNARQLAAYYEKLVSAA